VPVLVFSSIPVYRAQPPPAREKACFMSFNPPSDLDKYREIGAAHGLPDLSDAALLSLWAFLETIAAQPGTYPPLSAARAWEKQADQAQIALNSKDKEASP